MLKDIFVSLLALCALGPIVIINGPLNTCRNILTYLHRLEWNRVKLPPVICFMVNFC